MKGGWRTHTEVHKESTVNVMYLQKEYISLFFRWWWQGVDKKQKSKGFSHVGSIVGWKTRLQSCEKHQGLEVLSFEELLRTHPSANLLFLQFFTNTWSYGSPAACSDDGGGSRPIFHLVIISMHLLNSQKPCFVCNQGTCLCCPSAKLPTFN